MRRRHGALGQALSPPPPRAASQWLLRGFLGLDRRSRGQSVVEFALIVPLMLLLLLAVADFARINTTMLAVESAAREAADFGTALGARRWDDATFAGTVDKMIMRACVASQNLPDYAGSGSTCTNPAFSYCISPAAPDGTYGSCGPRDPLDACDDPDRPHACRVTVTLTYDFRLLVPINIEALGTRYGLPSMITFQRDSTFAISDLQLGPPSP